jgi:hypothetical protein
MLNYNLTQLYLIWERSLSPHPPYGFLQSSNRGEYYRCGDIGSVFGELMRGLGAYEIGVLMSYAFFGMTTTQTYIYYSRFADDSRKLKSLVCRMKLSK